MRTTKKTIASAAVLTAVTLMLGTANAGGSIYELPHQPTSYGTTPYVLQLPDLVIVDIDVCLAFGNVYVDVDVMNVGARPLTGPVRLVAEVGIAGQHYLLSNTVDLDIAPGEKVKDVPVGGFELPDLDDLRVLVTIDPADPTNRWGDYFESNESNNSMGDVFLPDPTTSCGFSE